MCLNPHLHVVFLDGAYHEEEEDALAWVELGHVQTREVGEVLEAVVRRIERHLRRRGLLELGAADADRDVDSDEALAASAVSGRTAPAGPQWLRGLVPLAPSALRFDKPLCAALDGFTLHAATRAGALDVMGREALLRYVLRPPIAQERVESRPDGLVRITLKRPFVDGTVAVDMDPLSLLCRVAASVPPPRYHTVKYAGVLAHRSRWRPRIAPHPAVPSEITPVVAADVDPTSEPKPRRGGYRPWAELLARTFGVDVLACPKCHGRMKLVALIKEPRSIRRFLAALGEDTDVPARLPSRGAAVLEEHRPAPKGAGRGRIAAPVTDAAKALTPTSILAPRNARSRTRSDPTTPTFTPAAHLCRARNGRRNPRLFDRAALQSLTRPATG
jgi:hypothetical protein